MTAILAVAQERFDIAAMAGDHGIDAIERYLSHKVKQNISPGPAWSALRSLKTKAAAAVLVRQFFVQENRDLSSALELRSMFWKLALSLYRSCFDISAIRGRLAEHALS